MAKTPLRHKKMVLLCPAVDCEKKLRYALVKHGDDIKQTEGIMGVTAFDIKAILFDFDGTLTEPGGLDSCGACDSCCGLRKTPPATSSILL